MGLSHNMTADGDIVALDPDRSLVYSEVDTVTGGLINSVGGAYVNWSNTALAFPFDSDGIDAAIQRIVDSGAPGVVVYAATDYAVTRDHELIDNVSHIGTAPKLVMNGNVPDAGFSTNGGTRFICDPGVKCFKYGNVANATLPSPLAPTALKGVTMRNLTFLGGARHIDTGAYLSMGAVWSRFEELYSFDSSDFGLNFENFQHCTFHNLYQSSQVAGGGVRFACTLNGTLLPGNSTWTGEVYTYTPLREARSIMFEAAGPSGCQFNQLHVSGRLQPNRYGGAPLTSAITTTAGSPDVGVTDATTFAMLRVGMPIIFPVSAPQWLATGEVYFVTHKNTGNQTIRLSSSPYHTAGIAINDTTNSHIMHCNGFAGIEVIANDNSLFTNCDFGNWDVEASQTVAGIVLRRTRQSRAFVSELMGSSYGTAIVGRDAVFELSCASMATKTTDIDNTNVVLRNIERSARTVTAGETLSSPRHGCTLQYNAGGAGSFVIPAGLVAGFEMVGVQLGAGKMMFSAGAGVTLVSKGGLLSTSGTGATVTLRATGKNTYVLSGDIAA